FDGCAGRTNDMKGEENHENLSKSVFLCMILQSGFAVNSEENRRARKAIRLRDSLQNGSESWRSQWLIGHSEKARGFSIHVLHLQLRLYHLWKRMEGGLRLRAGVARKLHRNWKPRGR